jgi:hypothetical protein
VQRSVKCRETLCVRHYRWTLSFRETSRLDSRTLTGPARCTRFKRLLPEPPSAMGRGRGPQPPVQSLIAFIASQPSGSGRDERPGMEVHSPQERRPSSGCEEERHPDPGTSCVPRSDAIARGEAERMRRNNCYICLDGGRQLRQCT